MDSFQFQAIGFAGGGNRCYWQGGFWEALNAIHPQKPDYIVAVSAGSYQSCFNIIGIGAQVRQRAYAISTELKQSLARTPDWRIRPSAYFRRFLEEIFGEPQLAMLRQAPEILIQLCHPPKWLPVAIAAPSVILAYQLERALTDGTHSRAGHHLRFTHSWASIHQIATPADLVEAIMSSSAVPPFMPVGKYGGRTCLDGGFVDNPPLAKLEKTEARGGRTLLLTTRFGSVMRSSRNRIVVGPSRNLKVRDFTVRDPDGLREAYEMGLRDGEAFANFSPSSIPRH